MSKLGLALLGFWVWGLSVLLAADERDRTQETVWSMVSGDDALAHGFPQLAAAYYEEALASGEELSADVRMSLQLKWVVAYIAQEKYNEAQRLLSEVEGDPNDDYFLVRSLVLLGLGKIEQAQQWEARINRSRLNAFWLPWFYVQGGLWRSQLGQKEEAILFLKEAKDLFVDAGRKAWIDVLIFQIRIQQGDVSEEIINQLQTKLANPTNQNVAYRYARELAIAYYQQGDNDAATDLLEAQLALLPPEKVSAKEVLWFTVAMIVGPDSVRGKDALLRILHEGEDKALQIQSLVLLNRWYASSNAEDYVAALSQLLRDHPNHVLYDRLLLSRARLYVAQGATDSAFADALQVVESFPGSVLLGEAYLLLAYQALQRDPPQYRVASSYLLNLLEGSVGGRQQSLIQVLLADCFFLSGEFGNAANAYQAVLTEGAEGVSLAQVYFRKALAEIRANQVAEARKSIDAFARLPEMPVGDRWLVELEFVDALYRRDRVEEAYQRLSQSLEAIPTELLSKGLLFNIALLQARLCIDTERPAQVLTLLEPQEGIMGVYTVDNAAIHFLRGEALLAMDRYEQAKEEFAVLRRDSADSNWAERSYLLQSRYLSSQERLVDAQVVLNDFIAQYPNSKYAVIGMYEAALQITKRKTKETDKEALLRLAEIVEKFPDNALAFPSLLKQAEIFEENGDVGDALLVYEKILSDYPGHRDIAAVKLARAQVMHSLSDEVPPYRQQSLRAMEELSSSADVPLDLKVEVFARWGFALWQQGNVERAEKVYWNGLSRFLLDVDLANELGGTGRWWLSQLVFRLGDLQVSLNNVEKSFEVYRMVIEYQLPGAELARAKLQMVDATKESVL